MMHSSNQSSSPLRLEELSETVFEDFAKKQSSSTFLQSVQLFRRYKLENREAYLLGGFDGDKLIAAALCTKKYERLGKKIFNLPRGPILDYEAESSSKLLIAFLKKVEQFLKKKGGMVIQISPNVFRKVSLDVNAASAEPSSASPAKKLLRDPWPKNTENLTASLEKSGYKNLGEFEQIKWAYFLDLENRSEEDLLMSFRYDARRSIKQNEDRYSLSLKELDPSVSPNSSAFSNFLDLLNKTGARRGFKNPERRYFENMKSAFGEDVHFVLAECNVDQLAEKDRPKNFNSLGLKPVSAGMFVYSGNEVVYLYSGSDPAFNKMNAPVLVIWKMIKLAKAKNCKYFNFYGTHPIPNSADASVFNFKQNFHGDIVEYVGTFAKPLDLAGKLYLSRLKYSEFRHVS